MLDSQSVLEAELDKKKWKKNIYFKDPELVFCFTLAGLVMEQKKKSLHQLEGRQLKGIF